MATRDAVSTIRGYFYQFDYSILQVLRCENDTDTICVEGIEDVDVNDGDNITLYQCKCYEGTEYDHSKIKEGLKWMLKHFAKDKDSGYKYYLYGVYQSGQHKLPQDITVEFAKENFFTQNHKNAPAEYLYQDLSLTDDDISLFLQKLKIDIYAVEFDKQEKMVHEELSKSIGCKLPEIEPYYCNALSIIRRLAVQKNTSDRTISRRQFIEEVKKVNDQFDAWLLKRVEIDRFAKIVKKMYFSNGISVSPFARFFLIECKKGDTVADIKSVILLIAKKYGKLSKRSPKRFCPYFLLYNLEDEKLLKLKKALFTDDIRFRDGFDFRGACFSTKYLTEEPETKNPVQFRIIDKIDYLAEVFANLHQTIEIYQFYTDKPFYPKQKQQIKHIQIPFVSLDNITKMV